MKVLLGSAGGLFILSAIFWAGATYQRVGAIELRLAGIESQLARIGDIRAIDERSANTQRRIEKLEDESRERAKR